MEIKKVQVLSYTRRTQGLFSKEMIKMNMYSYETVVEKWEEQERTKYNDLYFQRLDLTNNHDWKLWKDIKAEKAQLPKSYTTGKVLNYNETLIGRIAKAFPKDKSCAERKPYGDFKQFDDKFGDRLTRKDVYDHWVKKVEEPLYNGKSILEVVVEGFKENEITLKGKRVLTNAEIVRAYSMLLYKLTDGVVKEFWVLRQMQAAFKKHLDDCWEVRAAAPERETDEVDAEVFYNGVFVCGISIKCGGALSFSSLDTFRNVYGKDKPEFYVGVCTKDCFETLIQVYELNNVKEIPAEYRLVMKDAQFGRVGFVDFVGRLRDMCSVS